MVSFGAAEAISGRSRPTYTASAFLVVSSGANSKGPGSSSEAANLATTYAGLIPKDSSILTYVSQKTGSSINKVRSSISVATDTGTSILEIKFSASSSSAAIAGDRDTALAIGGKNPVSSSVPSGSVTLASLPRDASQSTSTKTLAVPVGLLAGFALGVALALIWERIEPRVDTSDDLESVVSVPVTTERDFTPRGAFALLSRWGQLGRREGATVGLVMLKSGEVTRAANLGSRLLGDAGLFAAGKTPEPRGGNSSPVNIDIIRKLAVRAFGVPGTTEAGHLAAIECDVVVLVAYEGIPARTVGKAVKALTEFGHSPDWAILLDRSWSESWWRRFDAKKTVSVASSSAGKTSDEQVVAKRSASASAQPASRRLRTLGASSYRTISSR